jgi:hypothetical protein
MKKGIGSGVGSGAGFGSFSQRFGSGDPDPDPHQNVTDPQHWKENRYRYRFSDIPCFKKILNLGPADPSVGVFFRIRKFYLSPPSRPGIL